MPFPPAFLDDLRARLPLSEEVARRVPLVRAGREFRACCPFHNEKSPSFYVNDQKGFFHCFGCGAHGDVVGFVMRYDRIGFPEAIELLAQQAGLEVPRLSREEVEREKQRKTVYQLCEAACVFFSEQLRTARGRAALDYLRGRGLGDEIITRFRLGYAPADGGALISCLKAQGYDVAQMVEAGLARQADDGGRTYAFFRDRVMFPVCDRRGRVVAFGGRIMSGEGPKYINSPDHSLFHKGKLLYSLARAREAAPRGAPLVVVEGYMDVIAMVEAGFPAAVAPLGTALTEAQIEEMWKCGGTGGDPVLCFDGDVAGQRAAARAVERVMPLLGPGRTVRFAFLPGGQDPDDLIRSRGAAAMQQVLEQAIPLVDMLWKLETGGQLPPTPEARAGAKQALERRVDLIADETVKTYYRSELRRRLNDSFGWGRAAGRPSRPPRSTGQGGLSRLVRQLPPDPGPRRQRLVLLAILHHPAIFEQMGELLVDLPPAGPLDKLWQAVVTTLETKPDLDPAELRCRLCDLGFADPVEQLLREGATIPDRWARATAGVEEAIGGLRELVAHGRVARMTDEMERVAADLGDEGRRARAVALRREAEEARAAVLSGDGEMA